MNLKSLHDLRHFLFDVMNDGVLIIDRRGTIVDCNQTFHVRLGYAKDELIGLSVSDIDTPENAARIFEHIDRAMNEGLLTFETVHRHKDGSVMPVEINARSVSVHDDAIFCAIVRDISRRKKMETNLQETSQIYQAAINTPALGFWAVDIDGRIVDVNDAYLDKSGYNREELLAMRISDIEATEKPEETEEHIKAVIRQGHERFRSQHRRKDGSVWPVEIVINFSRIWGGLFLSFLEDITEKVQQENSLGMAYRIIETMDQAVVVTDAENKIIKINPATSRISGYTFEEVRGCDPKIFSSGHHGGEFYSALWKSLKARGHWEGEIWDRRKDGEVYAKWMTVNAICDARGRVSNYISVFSDITERKKSEEMIWRQANYDSLTGLPNRHLFCERLDQAIKKANRYGNSLAVLFIDLDRFKEVNDNLGHSMGDELLVQAAKRILAHIRETDTVARLGGDEFTVILPDYGQRSNLDHIAWKLIQELARPYELSDSEAVYLSASIGITIYPDDAVNLGGLLKNADQAMYLAKGEGRNRVGYFTPSMQQEALEKMVLTNDLRKAIDRQELEVYYQPIVDLKNGRIYKAEALLRWHHPERGMISPTVFIPLAEDSGLIHIVGEWVFHEAICCINSWRNRYDLLIQVSVNKSVIQFNQPGDWLKTLRKMNLPGNSIVVEITESLLMSKSQSISDQFQEYHRAGIEVSIDDFGTGFSALSYLHQFDIDYLKIDRLFIAGLEGDSGSTALTEAIIVMARKLGIKTIAEGVEHELQRDLIMEFGCDYAQGFLYAEPLPVEEFEQIIAPAGKILERPPSVQNSLSKSMKTLKISGFN